MKRFIALLLVVMGISLFAADLDSIEKAHDAKIKKAEEKHKAEVEKINKDTIRKLEYLLKKFTRAGNLDEAVKVKNTIERIKGEDGDELDDDDEIGLPQEPDSFSKSNDRIELKQIRKRYRALHAALADNDIDTAIKYVDPEIVKCVASSVLKGHLQIVAGILQAHKITKRGLDTDSIILGKKNKDAKIIGRWRVGMGQWHTQKPAYWVKRKGEWYLGDEKELKKFKAKKK